MFEIKGTDQIPAGTYVGSLESVEPMNSSFGEGRKWTFLVDVNGELKTVTGLTSLHTGPGSKVFKWLAAINGEAPQAGAKVEPPIGKRCVLDVIVGDNGYSKISEVRTYVEPAQTVPGIPR